MRLIMMKIELQNEVVSNREQHELIQTQLWLSTKTEIRIKLKYGCLHPLLPMFRN